MNAHLRAAETLESLPADAREIKCAEGINGVIKLPAIGRGLAASIAEIASTGRWLQLDRLRGSSDREAL